MSNVTEASLLADLSRKLVVLGELEGYPRHSDPERSLAAVSWTFGNDRPAHALMQEHVSIIVSEHLGELLHSAIARQRQAVQAAREALAAFQTKPQDPPLDEKTLDSDPAADMGRVVGGNGAEGNAYNPVAEEVAET